MEKIKHIIDQNEKYEKEEKQIGRTIRNFEMKIRTQREFSSSFSKRG